MTILNIGGAGFIGSVATESFIKKGHKVIILDDLSTGYKELIHPKATFIKGSMLDYALLNRIFKKYKIDTVALYAAKIVVSESVAKPNDYYLTNVTGTTTVLKAMAANNVKKIIFASSAAVYGKCKKIPVDERSETNPCNPYGASKLMCERIIKDAQEAYGINYVIYRFFNVAGASKSGKYGSLAKRPSLLVPSINNCILKHKRVSIYGNQYKTKDGTCIRDYVHVEDLANAAILALNYLNQEKSGIFCLGSNCGYSVYQVVKLAQKLLDKKLKYEFVPNRPGDPDALLTKNTKALKELGWQPQYTLEEMILSDYNFRKNNIE